jgi:hypothetical protein
VFREHNQTMAIPAKGAWTLLVRAEVLFANGDTKGAIELASTTDQEEIAPEQHQPDDLYLLRSDAALRYRGR